jgi:hypothetical protein
MENEIETIIKTEDGVRLSLNAWDDGGAWLHLMVNGGSAYTPLTRAEAEQLLVGLQAILEVTA